LRCAFRYLQIRHQTQCPKVSTVPKLANTVALTSDYAQSKFTFHIGLYNAVVLFLMNLGQQL